MELGIALQEAFALGLRVEIAVGSSSTDIWVGRFGIHRERLSDEEIGEAVATLVHKEWHIRRDESDRHAELGQLW